jgi:serine protease Do
VLRVEAGGGGYLGASLSDVAGDDLERLRLSEPQGALVERVTGDSPAARAGLRAGDVILRFGGEAVRSAAQFARLVRETPPGRRVELELSRGGSVQKLSCELGQRAAGRSGENDARAFEFALPELPELSELPELPEGRELPLFAWRDFGRGLRSFELPGSRARLGLSYQAISGQLARYFKLEADSGVLVTQVEPGGPAEQGGLQAGDVISSFDGHVVSAGSDLRQALRAAEGGHALSVEVVRDGRKLELKVTMNPAGAERSGEPH